MRLRAAAAGVLVALAAAGQIAGFEVATGKVISRISTGQRLTAGVGASGSIVLVGSVKGEVLAYDAGGKQLWKTLLPGELLAPPAIDGSLVVVRVGDGRLYGLNANDGQQRWVYQRSSPA